MTTAYVMKHTTNYVKAYLDKIIYKINVDTLHREAGDAFLLNEIGRVEISTATPIFFDQYKINHATGSFILIDPLTNNTVAAGMIRGVPRMVADVITKSPHKVWGGWNIPREVRERRNAHKAAVLWLTGYSGSGKSTISRHLENKLFEAGYQTMLLDGDNIRHGLCRDLGFSGTDRSENIRRAGEVAKLFFESGHIVICSFISPFIRDRQFVRSLFPEKSFFEIYVQCDLEICKRRDPNGLYKKAMSGEISEFTGVSSPYEEPPAPEIVVKTDRESADQIADSLINRLRQSGIILTDDARRVVQL
jgi:bifunctional enzyme CysN/CysC